MFHGLIIALAPPVGRLRGVCNRRSLSSPVMVIARMSAATQALGVGVEALAQFLTCLEIRHHLFRYRHRFAGPWITADAGAAVFD